MRIVNGSVFDGDGFVERDVFAAEGRFVEEVEGEGDVLDASGCYVIPGLIDLHFHGSAGADMSDGDLEGLHRMGAYEASRGVTAMCPATMTLPEDVLMRAAQAAAAYEPAANEAALVGINMEGPFISPSKVGAQNPEYVRNPGVEEFRRLQEAAGGLFKIVDIAPEEPGADEFIRELSGEVRISLAHTCTDYDTAAHAFELGARHLTHLFNAMDPMHHRKPGPIPAAAERDDVTPEIIADGIHIHPAVVRTAFRQMPGRICVVSDAMRLSGMPDGQGMLGVNLVTVKDGRATLEDGTIAGSVTNLHDELKNLVSWGIPLEEAVRAMTLTPAKEIGMDEEIGSIAVGKRADLVVLDENLEIVAVYH